MTQERLNCLLPLTLPVLYRYAHGCMLTHEDAEDLMQDTLLHIAERREYYHDYNLCGLACKVLIYLYRNRLRHNYPITYLSDISTDERSCDATAGEMEEDLNHLQQPFREAIQLLVAGYGYEEIARKQSVPVGTIKSRIHRARKMLRRLWE